MIIKELIAQAMDEKYRAETSRIKKAVAGLGYTAVQLEDGRCGMAYTFRGRLGMGCSVFSEAGTLSGRKAEELMAWTGSTDLLRSAYGLATVNAVLNGDGADTHDGNVMDAFDAEKTDVVGMVGDFMPIRRALDGRVKEIKIFEQAEGSGYLKPDRIPDELIGCSIIVVTATAIINNTIDGILEHCGDAKEVCITGPSTPLSKEVFDRHNVTMLAGTVVTDPEKLLTIVSQGGGTMNMKPATKHVLVRMI
ncbi:MAG: DUF364 domain-containing protein [Eubacteriaceae bacterium]|nr:DUF364 domain-containing protein [Eubacteriaceae bacterium]